MTCTGETFTTKSQTYIHAIGFYLTRLFLLAHYG